MAEVQKVSIRIDVTDNAQVPIQGVTQSLNQMGEAGATSGAKVETAMKGMTGATAAANVQVDAMQARLRGLYAQVQALSPAGMKIFNEQVPGFTKGGMSPLDAQEASLARTAQLLEQNAAGAGKVAGSYGEMRIAIGAATGNMRQMEMGLASMAGRMKGIAPLFNAMMPALMGIAVVAIIVQMGEAVYQLYEKWLDTDGAIDQYNAKAAQAAEKRFFQNSGLDELNRDLKQANQQLDQLQNKQATAPSVLAYAFATGHPGAALLTSTLKKPFSMTDANELNQAQGKSDQDMRRMLEDIHKENVQRIQDNTAKAEAGQHPGVRAALAKAAAGSSAAENQIDAIARQQLEHDITSRPTGLKPGQKGYTPPLPAPTGSAQDLAAARSRIAEVDKLPLSTTGSAERRMADEHAAAQFNTAQKQNATETQNEVLRLQHQADEAELTGIRLLEQKRKDADSEYVAMHGQSIAAIKAINRSYYAQESKFLDEQNKQRQQAEQEAARELQRMHDEALLAGLSGAARIEQQGKNGIADFYSQEHPGMNPGQRLASLYQITQQTQQSLARETQSFADEVSGVLSRTVDRSLSGFARIHADADAEVAKLKSDAALHLGSSQELALGIAGVRKGEDADITALRQRNNEQTEALEAQARNLSLSGQRNQTAAIEDEFEERTRKFKEELDQQIASAKLTTDDLASLWENYGRRVVAAGKIRDAEMAQSAREVRDKMAGEFTSFFHGLDHPMQLLANMGDKVAGQAAASLVQRFQNRGKPHGSQPEELSMDSLLGHIFGRIAGKPRGATAGPEELGIATPGAAASGKKSIALATAEIFVQNASIGFAGAGFRGAGAPGSVGSSGTLLATSFHAGTSGGFSSGSTVAPGTNVASSPSSGTGAALMAHPAVRAAAGSELASTPTPASSVGAFGPGGWTGGNFSVAGSGSGAAGIPGRGNTATAAVGVGQEAVGMFGGAGKIGAGLNKLGGVFGGGSSTASATKNGGMLGGGGFGANLGGAAGGALGMFSAYEGKGGVSGGLEGAMSGMKLGAALGGPIGAGIGAAAGAIVGAIGFGGREQGRVYDLKTVRPRIAQDVQAYETGGMNYLSAYSEVQALDMQAKQATNRMGSGGQSYYQDTIKPEIRQAEGHFSSMERAGRGNFTAQAAMFDVGADYVPRDGMAMIHEGERILPSDQNERITKAMEGGAESRRMPAQSNGAWSGDVHIHAVDAKGVRDLLFSNKHHIRAAVNASFAENSGGADGY